MAPDLHPLSARDGASEMKKRKKRRKKRRTSSDGASRVTFPMPHRLVVIGDLNGDDDALAALLRGTGVIDRTGAFIADNVHLVQLGDVVNRGSGCRAALERLMRLSVEARKKNSHVTVLLGNHEAMVTLQNLAWCHPEEFLEFATPEERMRFEHERSRRVYELLDLRSDGGRTAPISGALRAWEEAHVPGKDAYLRAFAADGHFGAYLRELPVAIRVGPVLLVHGGLTPRWADGGLKQLDERVREVWAKKPRTAFDLTPDNPLAAEDGPLWCRTYAAGNDEATLRALDETLRRTRSKVMIIGHTRTDLIGGERGVPLVKLDGRLICADVGIGSSGGAPSAVYVEKDVVWCWRPDDRRRRLAALT